MKDVSSPKRETPAADAPVAPYASAIPTWADPTPYDRAAVKQHDLPKPEPTKAEFRS